MAITTEKLVLNENGIREAISKMLGCQPETMTFVINDGELQVEVVQDEDFAQGISVSA